MPVSAGLLADPGAYFAALTSFRDGDAAPIVERFSQATVLAIANGRQLVTDLRDVRETWDDVITARSHSAVWKVADLLARRPVVNAALPAKELGIESTNAHRYLNPLTEAGILVETTNGPATECGVLLKCPRRTRRAARLTTVFPRADQRSEIEFRPGRASPRLLGVAAAVEGRVRERYGDHPAKRVTRRICAVQRRADDGNRTRVFSLGS